MPDAPRSYPSDPADAALRLFLDWFGRRYARSARAIAPSPEDGDGALRVARVRVGRRWEMECMPS